MSSGVCSLFRFRSLFLLHFKFALKMGWLSGVEPWGVLVALCHYLRACALPCGCHWFWAADVMLSHLALWVRMGPHGHRPISLSWGQWRNGRGQDKLVRDTPSCLQ